MIIQVETLPENPACCLADHECPCCQQIQTPCVDCERDAWRACAERLAADLQWCSGSSDFAPFGEARIGWVRGPQQSLAEFERLRDGK